MENKKGIPSWLKIIALIVIVVGGYFAWTFYKAFFASNVSGEKKYLYIHEGETYEDVLKSIKDSSLLDDAASFERAAQYKKYQHNVKPGRYLLIPGMNNRRLIGNLMGGYQEPVKFRFANVRLKENMAALLGKNFEADSAQFIAVLNDEATAQKYGFTKENLISMFIPNTYEIYWNTNPEKVIARFDDEWKKFWNADRTAKAKALNLTPQQVSTLASIVKGEALHQDEMPMIAGLYLNRLKKGMLLQADPTVIFANNDFTIRRVLNKHLRTDNPYNTYIYRGLPPGPISIPSIAAIDAVLNFKQHDYIYMCAKDDFSGYHNFAKTEAEHLINARKFQQALDARNIKKIMFVFDHQIRVRYAETDQMGYVYYGNYAAFYEIARTEMLRSTGISYRELEEMGVMLPVAEMKTKYLKPGKYDDLITIRVTIRQKPAVRIIFEYELFNECGELLNQGETTLVFVNMEKNRPCMPPQIFLDKMSKYFN